MKKRGHRDACPRYNILYGNIFRNKDSIFFFFFSDSTALHIYPGSEVPVSKFNYILSNKSKKYKKTVVSAGVPCLIVCQLNQYTIFIKTFWCIKNVRNSTVISKTIFYNTMVLLWTKCTYIYILHNIVT